MLEATKTVADGELCAHVAGFAEGLLAPFTFSQLLDRYGIAGINEEVFDEESETCRHHDVAAMDVRFYVALVPWLVSQSAVAVNSRLRPAPK